MRVRVRFRYNSETGEVETFLIEDIGGVRPGVDHDAVHDAVTADVARIIEQNALIDEVQGSQAYALPESSRNTATPAVDDAARRSEERPISE